MKPKDERKTQAKHIATSDDEDVETDEQYEFKKRVTRTKQRKADLRKKRNGTQRRRR